jgi:rhodanese-related sulfurtransferase
MASPYTIKWRLAIWQIPAVIFVAGILAISVNAIRSDSLPLIGDWSIDARLTTITGDQLNISLQEAKKLFHGRSAVFLDARSAEAYARGHIQGARSLPWQDVNQFFVDVSENLQLETPIVTYCDGETCKLSHDLAVYLKDMGFMNVRVLVNGWSIWQAAGLPLATTHLTKE